MKEEKFNEAVEHYEKVHREEIRLVRETYQKALEVGLADCETWDKFVERMRCNIGNVDNKEATLELIAISLACEEARKGVEDAWKSVEETDMVQAVELVNHRIWSTVLINLMTDEERNELVEEGQFTDKKRRVSLNDKLGIVVEEMESGAVYPDSTP